MPPITLRSGLPSEPSAEEILRFKGHFKVSAMALNYALRETGQLTEWGHRQNCVRLSELGYRSGEPEGMSHYETSRVFGTIFRSREGRENMAKVTADLGLTASELHSMAFGMPLHTVTAVDAQQHSETNRPTTRPQLKLIRST
jgi:hypothetical protein